MLVIITYDVSTETAEGKKRLRKVAEACEDYGQRVQNSVFECLIDSALLKQLQVRLVQLIDEESDSLRFYYLGEKWQGRVEHIGAKKTLDLQGTIIT